MYLECTIPSHQDALLGRENPLSDVDPMANIDVLEDSVEEELRLQFNVRDTYTQLYSLIPTHMNAP